MLALALDEHPVQGACMKPTFIGVIGRLPDLSAGLLVLIAAALFTSGLLFREPLPVVLYAGLCIVLYALATMGIISVWRQPQMVETRSSSGYSRRRRFGWANRVTLGRLLITILLAALVPLLALIRGADWSVAWSYSQIAYALLGLSAACLLLDGVDGYVARRTRTATAFGARFDMEVDAAFILVLCSLLWALGIAQVWVFAIGLMRYGFLAAALVEPRLSQPLPSSMRRKSICVVQVISLIGCLHPAVSSAQATAILGTALVLLTYSFLSDVMQLLARSGR